jgi:NADPH:quinone reductase-like Zn-dependent oxidoreductase
MLMTRARLVESDTVLVLAAGSGVGQAAVQIARAARARVVTTVRGAAKAARASALGADLVVDVEQDDLLTRVRQFTGGRGVDVVVEHIGQATWETSVRCLARGGRLVTCGATSGFKTELDLRHLFARQLSLLGSYMGSKAELLRAAALFFRGAFAPVVDRTFPLSETAQAHRRMESADRFGKIVLVVD